MLNGGVLEEPEPTENPPIKALRTLIGRRGRLAGGGSTRGSCMADADVDCESGDGAVLRGSVKLARRERGTLAMEDVDCMGAGCPWLED